MTLVRRIAIVTTSRADYGLLRYVIKALATERRARLQLLVSGSHLMQTFGSTIREIEADGVPIAARIELPIRGDTGHDAASALGHAISAFAKQFARLNPDVVLVTGDRYEMLGAAQAAALSGHVVAHLCGGEVTGGSLDEGWRHAITKIAHIHMPATSTFARRIRLMGEDRWRIHVVGAPGLEAIRREPLPDRHALEGLLRTALRPPLAVCTYHPVTNDPSATLTEARALFAALRRSSLRTVIVTAPNADPGGRRLLAEIRAAVASDPHLRLVPSLGSQNYLGLLRIADLVIGNSSSGIIEAASFKLPSVNVGARQAGRPRPGNVIDVAGERSAILRAVERVLRPSFRSSLGRLRNPYGDGRTSARVREILLAVRLDARLRMKRFADPLPTSFARRHAARTQRAPAPPP